MSVHFGSNNGRSRTLGQRRMFFLGGTTLMFALLLAGALLIYSNVVQAREDVVARANDADIAFGTVALVAPSTRIPPGTKITIAHLKKIHWPRDQVPEGSVRNVDELEGRFSSALLLPNQPISAETISKNPPSFGIGELLPEGHRAVTIEVDEITGLEGWATPGAHVDLYLTYRDPKEGVFKTRVAVEDAVVLSYGGEAKKLDKFTEERNKIASTVTLAVPFEDSLKIQTAKAMGHITLALRNSRDMSSQGTGEFSANDWDVPHKAEAKSKFIAKGFATYTDPGGGTHQFVLGKDERWSKNNDLDGDE